MKREVTIKGIDFFLGNYTPRNNPYEKGMKYRVFLKDEKGFIPTSYIFATLKDSKEFLEKNYWMWK